MAIDNGDAVSTIGDEGELGRQFQDVAQEGTLSKLDKKVGKKDWWVNRWRTSGALYGELKNLSDEEREKEALKAKRE